MSKKRKISEFRYLNFKSFLIFRGPYTLGSAEFINLTFTILNKGENSYQPKLQLEINSANVTVIKGPTDCNQDSYKDRIIISCNLKAYHPLKNKEILNRVWTLNINNVNQENFEVKANVSDSSKDISLANNIVKSSLKLVKFSKVKVFG